jgi:large subunit ribosomal protein L15
MPSIRGFTNIFKTKYAEVNVGDLERFDDGDEVTAATLAAAGIIRGTSLPVKVLGDGNVSKNLRVRATKFTETARTKIEAAGGAAEVVARA